MSLCLLCPGQGGQSPEMFERIGGDGLLAPHLERLSLHLLWDPLAVAADPERCFLNRYAQPLIMLYGLVTAAVLEEARIDAGLVAGYSVGELTAHAVSGALSAPEALMLAERRAACMDRASPAGYGMLAVRGVPLATLEKWSSKAGVVIAIRNGPDHAVLAGPADTLSQLAGELAASGAHGVPLPVSVPAHSPWLAAAVEPFGEALGAARWQLPRMPVLAGITGQPVYSSREAVTLLRRQLVEPIDWSLTLDITVEMGCLAFFELGPGRTLTRMIRERIPDAPARALDEFASFAGALDWLRRFS